MSSDSERNSPQSRFHNESDSGSESGQLSDIEIYSLSEGDSDSDSDSLPISSRRFDLLEDPISMKLRQARSSGAGAVRARYSGSRRPFRRSVGRGRGRRAPIRGRVGRGSRRATNAVDGECGCWQDVRVLEVCCDDDEDGEYEDLSESEHEEECYDASSVANEMFGGDRGAIEFEWSPMTTFSCRPEKFQSEDPGPNVNTSSAYDAFRQYWDDDILEHIVIETNRYAAELKSTSECFASSWYDTNLHEILILFSFWMMHGVIGLPTIKSCYSSSHLFHTDVFRTLLTETRYRNLNRALHFVNNATRQPNSNKLFCLGPLVKHLNTKFQEAYTLGQNITIESLKLWEDQVAFKQYTKAEAPRHVEGIFGIQTYELCELSTGYVWSFIIAGKQSETQSRMQKSTDVVTQLMKPLLNKGHRLFLDRWFTSPLLARFLKRNKTDCVGTLRKSCKNLPTLIKVASLPEGKCVARHSGDVMVMGYQDIIPGYMISTCHGSESVHYNSKHGWPAYHMPAVVSDYYVSCGAVDKQEQMLDPFIDALKKNLQWYKKILKRLLNVSIYNSSIVVCKSTPAEVERQAFRLDLVYAIMQAHLPRVPRPQAREEPPRMPEGRLFGMHFISRNQAADEPLTNEQSVDRVLCRWCLVRNDKKVKSAYRCEKCDVALCLEKCFESFHTEP